jgi:hypothetical protein
MFGQTLPLTRSVPPLTISIQYGLTSGFAPERAGG